MNPGSGKIFFEEFFAYFLGKACWIADTNKRFDELEYQHLFRCLPHVDSGSFSKEGASRVLLARIQRFFAPPARTGYFTPNQERVGRHLGNFCTDIEGQLFKGIMTSAFRETGWDGATWYGIALDQHRLKQVLEVSFNIKLELPSSLYDKRDYPPALEAFYDLAIVAVVKEKYLKDDAFWWSVSESGGMTEFVFRSVLGASEMVRQCVTTLTFPTGLRS